MITTRAPTRVRARLPAATPAFGLALAATLLAACSAPGARVWAGYTQMKVSGDIGLTPSVSGVTTGPINVDVDEQLGLGAASQSFYGRAELDFGPVRLTGSAFQFSDSGQGRLQVDFGNISAGTDVSTDLDFINGKLALTFDILDLGPVRLSPGVGVDVFDLDMDVSETTGGTSESISEILPVPMLFAQAELDLQVVGLIVDFGGSGFNTTEADGRFYDVEALVYVRPAAALELFAGYRWINFNVDGESDGQQFDADLTFQGWLVGGGVSF